MDDDRIIELFWAREEEAIAAVSSKYGRLCGHVAGNILSCPEDREECLNDAWFGLWQAIPPQRPERLAVFVGRVVRNLALKRLEYLSAAKRSAQASCALEELEDCVSGEERVEDELENRRIEAAISSFLRAQEPEKRFVFIRRYWYFDSIRDICARTGFGQSKVKSMLSRTRKNLRAYLESEGIQV